MAPAVPERFGRNLPLRLVDSRTPRCYEAEMPIQTGIRNRVRMATQSVLNAVAKRLIAREYTLAVPQFYKVYSPWFQPEFLAQIEGAVRENTLLSEDRLYLLASLARQCAHLEGELAECGVYRGGSALLLARVLADAGAARPLHLFDSFEGMPSSVTRARDSHRQGDFGDTTLDHVRSLMAAFPFVTTHPGFIPGTFAGLGDRRFSLVHVDVDVYQSTLDCLAFFYPRMVSGGMFLFDDYGFRIYKDAERRAADEFFADKPERPIALPTGQALVIKL